MKKSLKFTTLFVLSLVLMIGLSACGNNEESEKETFIIATEAAFAPFEYLGENNEIVGVDIDISKAVAEKLGKKLEIKNMAFTAALESVQTGKVDMVAAGVTIKPDRLEKMDFSIPYFDSSQVAVVNVENPVFDEVSPDKLSGKIIAVQQGTVGDLWVIDNVTDYKDLRKFETLPVAASDLIQNKVELIIADKLVAEGMVANSDGKLMIAKGALVEGEKIALALPKGDTELKKVVDEVLQELIDSGKIDEFFENHKQVAE